MIATLRNSLYFIAICIKLLVQIYAQINYFWGCLMSSSEYKTYITVLVPERLLKMTHWSQAMHLEINLICRITETFTLRK